jgi:hypothetical protein
VVITLAAAEAELFLVRVPQVVMEVQAAAAEAELLVAMELMARVILVVAAAGEGARHS